MTDAAAAGAPIACRSCGARLAPATRRCPACGLRDPATLPAPLAPSQRVIPAGSLSVSRMLTAAIVGACAGAAITALVFIARPPRTVRVPVEVPAAAPAAPAAPAPAPSPPAAEPEVSRSRGRTDWLFFFKPGDRLVRMSDDGPAGMVIRTEKVHPFADGTAGPAYLIQLPDGGQRFIDADELERRTRLE